MPLTGPPNTWKQFLRVLYRIPGIRGGGGWTLSRCPPCAWGAHSQVARLPPPTTVTHPPPPPPTNTLPLSSLTPATRAVSGRRACGQGVRTSSRIPKRDRDLPCHEHAVIMRLRRPIRESGSLNTTVLQAVMHSSWVDFPDRDLLLGPAACEGHVTPQKRPWPKHVVCARRRPLV